MAAAVLKNPIPEQAAGLGTLRVRAIDVILSATPYTAGGISVPKSNLYLNEIYFAQVYDATATPTGLQPSFNKATPSLQLYQDVATTVVAQGRATLVGGTVTVTNSAVQAAAANQVILVTNAVASGTVGFLSVGTRTAGTSFVINSSSGSDTSQVDWVILANTPYGFPFTDRSTMTAGAVTVSNTATQAATTNQQIFTTEAVAGGTLSTVAIGTRTAKTSFALAAGGSDTSQVDSVVASPLTLPIIAAGRSTLTAGTRTVAAADVIYGSLTSVLAASAGQVILLQNAVAGGTTGVLSVGTRTANTNFVINSSSGTDTSQIDWAILAAPTNASGIVEVSNQQAVTGTFRVIAYGV